MGRKKDDTLKDLTENQKKAYNILIDIRSNKLTSYKNALQQILDLLGSKYIVSSEDLAKALLISFTTFLYGFSENREITLMSLGLMIPFDKMKITERRRKYVTTYHGKLEKEELDKRVDNLRKTDEKVLLLNLIVCISEIAEGQDVEFINVLNQVAVNTGFLVPTETEDGWYVVLPKFPTISQERTYIERTPLSKYSISDQEDVILDELHKKVADGERSLYVHNDNYFNRRICSLYAFKYQDEYEVTISINHHCYDRVKSFDISIMKASENGILSIGMPCDYYELQDLVESYKRLLFIYSYHSDWIMDGWNTQDDWMKHDTEVFFYLKSKGTILY